MPLRSRARRRLRGGRRRQEGVQELQVWTRGRRGTRRETVAGDAGQPAERVRQCECGQRRRGCLS
eukprot:53579-Chlamydomonas_euryale.AAC.1